MRVWVVWWGGGWKKEAHFGIPTLMRLRSALDDMAAFHGPLAGLVHDVPVREWERMGGVMCGVVCVCGRVVLEKRGCRSHHSPGLLLLLPFGPNAPPQEDMQGPGRRATPTTTSCALRLCGQGRLPFCLVGGRGRGTPLLPSLTQRVDTHPTTHPPTHPPTDAPLPLPQPAMAGDMNGMSEEIRALLEDEQDAEFEEVGPSIGLVGVDWMTAVPPHHSFSCITHPIPPTHPNPPTQEIARNPYSLKNWLRYLGAKTQAKPVKRYLLYERALKFLPGSYKLWWAYLQVGWGGWVGGWVVASFSSFIQNLILPVFFSLPCMPNSSSLLTHNNRSARPMWMGRSPSPTPATKSSSTPTNGTCFFLHKKSGWVGGWTGSSTSHQPR